MPVALKGATSGQVTVDVPAVAGTNTLTLPAKTGNIITSADSGTVTQGMVATGVAATGPAFSAYLSATQTITLATYTKVNIDTTLFDTASCFDTTNKRFTPTVAGYYQINGLLRGVAATTFTANRVAIYKNGSLYADGGWQQSSLTNGSSNHVCVGEVIYLNGSTDYVELWGYIGGSGAATFNYTAATTTSRFSGALVRSA